MDSWAQRLDTHFSLPTEKATAVRDQRTGGPSHRGIGQGIFYQFHRFGLNACYPNHPSADFCEYSHRRSLYLPENCGPGWRVHWYLDWFAAFPIGIFHKDRKPPRARLNHRFTVLA